MQLRCCKLLQAPAAMHAPSFRWERRHARHSGEYASAMHIYKHAAQRTGGKARQQSLDWPITRSHVSRLPSLSDAQRSAHARAMQPTARTSVGRSAGQSTPTPQHLENPGDYPKCGGVSDVQGLVWRFIMLQLREGGCRLSFAVAGRSGETSRRCHSTTLKRRGCRGRGAIDASW